MDNGGGAITETHLAEMNSVEEGIVESIVDNKVVASLQESKDSDGEEVFEEVIEGNLDDVTPVSNGLSTDIAADDVFTEISNLPWVDQISGVSHVGETVENVTGVADDVGSPVKESSENGQNSLVMEGVHELLVANVNDKGGTASEGVPTNSEKVINEDSDFATIDDSGSIKEVVTEKLKIADNGQDENNDKELLVVSEREATKDIQHPEENSVQVTVVNHMPENKDAEEMEPDHGIVYQVSEFDGLPQQDEKDHDLKDVGVVVRNNHLDEANRDARLTSTGIFSEEQTNEFEKKESLTGGREEVLEFLDAVSGSKEENQESIDAPHRDDSQRIEEVVSDDETNKESDDQITLLSDEQEGSSELNDSSSAVVTQFEKSKSQVPDKEKSEAVTTISGIDNGDTNQIRHANLGVRDTSNLNLVEEHVKEVKVDEKNQMNQTSRETEMKPVATGASPPATSSNPAIPPTRPAGLGHGAPLLEPTPRLVQQPRANGTVSQVQAQLVEGSANGEPEEGDETREKLQMIRVKFLRLAHRLGQTPHNVVVAQVLYRLGLAEQLRGRNGARAGNFSFDRASAMAEQLEATGQELLDFACTIMVLGKTGVGKSATINSIFDEVKFCTDAFQFGTKKVQDVVGTVQGIKVRVIDTPGLLSSWSDQRQNEKTLHSVKRFIKKSPPDIILYLDRLDMQSRDFGDMPLLRTITDTFGPSIWFNAIVVLTHAATAPPDGPNGVASSYEMLVTQRSHVVQNAIRQAAGDMRLMNPVALVENHSACRTNRAGQRVLPNGQVWKPHLLLLSFASKILAEANTLLKLQDTPPGKPFPTRSRAPPLPFLLSSLLQSRPQLKLPEEQLGDDDDNDDLDDSSDSDDESEYDELPPFKRLTNAQLATLTKDQRKAYYDELEYREKLFMKKQLKEEKKRRKMMKKMAAVARDMPSDYAENAEDESGAAASVPVPMPDLALPASFDADNPTHRYRCLDNSNQWLVRPVLDSHGWDHDVGYEGINVERMFVVKNKVPLSVSGQVSKDKKEANVQMEVSSSMTHGEGKGTTVGFDMQSAGKDMAYTLRSETKFSNYKHNKATAGLSATLLGDTVSAGLKVEDKLIVNKRFRMVMSGGAMTSRGDVAYGGSLEATLRDRDYPLGRFLSTLGLSVMDWHGDLAIGCNLQSQIPVGRSTNLIARGNLNNRGSGQVSIRLNSSEQIQIALIGLIPLIQKIIGQQPQQQPYGH